MKKTEKRLSTKNFDYLYTVKRLLPVGILTLVFLFMSTVVVTALINVERPDAYMYFSQEAIEMLSDPYCIISSRVSSPYFVLFLTIIGAICGYVCFAFFQNERKLFSVLSYPEKRKNIIWERVKAFICVFLSSVLIPMLISFVVNITKYGISNELLLCFAAFTLSGIVAGLWSFLCVSVSLYLTSSKIRSSIYSVSFVFFPSFFSYVLRSVCPLLLKSMEYQYWEIDEFNELERVFYLISPNLIMIFTDWSYSFGLSVYNKYESIESFAKSTVYSSLMWILLCIVIYFVCKKLFVKKFDAENKFSKSSSIFGNTITSLTVSLISYNVCVYYFDNYATAYYANFMRDLSIFVVSFIVALILIDIKHLKLKKIAEGISIYVIIIVSVTAGIFFTDGFGYEKRVPKETDIESVTLQSGFNDYDSIYNTFTCDSDIKTVVALHKSITENETNHDYDSYTYFTYKLKNGTIVNRVYETSARVEPEMFKYIFETESYRDDYCSYFFGDDTEEYKKRTKVKNVYISQEELYDSLYGCPYEENIGYTFKDYDIIIHAKKDGICNYPVYENICGVNKKSLSGNEYYRNTFSLKDKITEKAFNEIKEALYEDLINENCDEYIDSFNNNFGSIGFIEVDDYTDEDPLCYEDRYFLTENSVNTFKVLEKYGLTDYLESIAKKSK